MSIKKFYFLKCLKYYLFKFRNITVECNSIFHLLLLHSFGNEYQMKFCICSKENIILKY